MDDLCDQLIEEEGSIAWPYLDTRGNVTVGVGHRIPNVEAAEDLPWLYRGQPATLEQLRAGWYWLISQTPGLVASTYRRDLTLSDAAIRNLLTADLASTRKRVRGVYKGFDNYPASAQKALLDMGFNLGVAGLILKFPHLHFMAEAGQWAQCATECERQGISEDRNQRTAQLFLQSV